MDFRPAVALWTDKLWTRGPMVVVPAIPFRRSLIWLGSVLTVLLAGVLGYFFAINQSEFDHNLAGQLSERIEILEGELDDIRRQLVDSKLAGAIDSQALAIQREEMSVLRETIRDLREQVGFYRRLMDSSSTDQPLEIADLEIFEADGVGDIRYRLLLTRPTDMGDWVSGTLWLALSGIEDGQESTLSLAEVSNLSVYPIEFKFRYFKRLSGSLRLPAGFRPKSILVKVAFGSGKATGVERLFAWPETGISATSGAGS